MRRIIKLLFTICLLTVTQSCFFLKGTPENITNPHGVFVIDLLNIQDDRMKVSYSEFDLPTDTLIYRLPRIVPGVYEISDFGKYVENFRAFSGLGDGEELQVERIDINSWQVVRSYNSPIHIEYYVNDTFDIELENESVPFSPAGNSFEEDIFLINLHGIVGYVDGFKELPLRVDITVKEEFNWSYSPSNSPNNSEVVSDSLVTHKIWFDRYFDVIDNPFMIGDIESESFNVGNITINLSVYSPNNIHSASSIKETIYAMMNTQKNYLGEFNSTDSYDIFVYLSEGEANNAQGFGALEHHASTVIVLPEWLEKEQLEETMIDLVSHGFFHIITPLSVHSEAVHFFNYQNPKFSKHLWMYEGVTEYFASHFQVYEGLQTREVFYDKIEDKISASYTFNDSLSFTAMSENILNEPYASNYLNVYSKGALISMCLDILLLEESNGERNLLLLMKELSTKYGTERPFSDDQLINEITYMTYPSIGEFFKAHVIGSTPINYAEIFSKVGLIIEETEEPTSFFFREDNINNAQTPFIDGNPTTNEVFFVGELNSTLKELGVLSGDVIKAINGEFVNLRSINASPLIPMSFSWGPETEISMVLFRDGEQVNINGLVGEPTITQQNLSENSNATAQQIQLRNNWLDK
jgi:predicted metalloprotease with PDZ domain